jgi:hypothetical protein
MLLLAIAVAGGYFGLPALVGCEKTRIRVGNALTRTLGIPVQVGAMSFSWTKGLSLRDVSTDLDPSGNSFRIDSVTIRPRWSKLLSGKVRLCAELESPQIVVVDSGREIRNLRLPKFGKKGLGLERVKITDGTCIFKSGTDDQTVRIDSIAGEGTGRFQHRSLRMDLQSMSGSWNGAALTGRAVLRLSQSGFAGELGANGDAAKETVLRDALRQAHITLKKVPAMSEPF